MGSGGSKSTALMLLVLNLGLYITVTIIAGWAVNQAIETTHETASVLSIPARIFPIYFPMGNMATGLLVIFSLLAGVVGVATSVTGVTSVLQWNGPNLCAAASSSLLTWALTMLAMGLACKDIYVGWTDANLRTLEVMTIIASATQLFCTGAIHAGAEDFAPTTLAAGTV
ncbi:binding protein [Hibiscus syriacus]|uniref:Binding protein n=1 Tax=Hibiscus syriacus TaxID=106335 RepID=A0A6A2XJ31_HIBSY|nr:membrane protein PM19L-like [Hibiscus syriacus]KAE8658469.1 binding protein [Hibiscus syriacus]